MKRKILDLRARGKSYSWIAIKLGLPKSTVAYHCSDRTQALAILRRRRRRRAIKVMAVEYKGSKCEKCGYSKCIAALEFHHPDHNEKELTLNDSISGGRSFESLKRELDKCRLFCANCHREVHAEIED